MLDIIIFIFGLIVGSFANVCIYRLPREESIVRPRSHCPLCGTPLAWYDNIPIFSFFILGGRCRTCNNQISPRYLLVEFLTALLFLLARSVLGMTTLLPFYWYFLLLLIIATFTDFEHLIIPDIVSISGLGLGLAASYIFPVMMGAPDRLTGLTRACLGLAAGAGSIWLVGVLGQAIFHKEAMGGGDVKLMAMAGTFLGVRLTLLTIFLGAFFGAAVGGILIGLRLKTRRDYIPFGPYLSLGAIVSLFWGEKLLSWYFGLLG